jgi:hypothetical protein
LLSGAGDGYPTDELSGPKIRRQATKATYPRSHQVFDDIRRKLAPFDSDSFPHLSHDMRLDHCGARGWQRQRNAHLDERVKAQIAIGFHEGPA